MYEATSQTISEDYKAENTPSEEWKFQIDNGNTGEMTISDALLETEALAEERAKSEFLKNSYKLQEIRFGTYRTDLYKNQTINVKGLPYLVKSVSTAINKTSIKTGIRAVRYE